jgi:hypothetical protein
MVVERPFFRFSTLLQRVEVFCNIISLFKKSDNRSKKENNSNTYLTCIRNRAVKDKTLR